MKPSIVLYGLDTIFLDEIVQGLIGENKINDNQLIDWTIDTKYYTVDVHVCPMNSKMLVDETVADSAEIIILLLDPNHINSRTKLDSWLPFLSVLKECQTKLIVARKFDGLSNTMSRTDIKQWCTEHEYDFIELEKSTTSETDDDEENEDEIYREVYGIPRLIELLHIHQWSNMNLKDRREINRNLAKQLKAKLNFDDDGNDVDHSEEQQKQNEQFDSFLTANNHHDANAFDMENIFEQMKKYKQEAEQLTGEERKQFAEKVVLDLWKTLGDGNDDDDSDDDGGGLSNQK